MQCGVWSTTTGVVLHCVFRRILSLLGELLRSQVTFCARATIKMLGDGDVHQSIIHHRVTA